jgi:hypothetical protein
MNYKAINFKFLMLTMGLSGLSLLTWALHHRHHQATVTPTKPLPDTLTRALVYDPELLARFDKVCKKYDTLSKQNFTMAGVINMTDGADTADRLQHTAFVFCKAGEDFYYRMGNTEVINERGLYLFVDNTSHKIVMGQHRGIQYGEPGIKPFSIPGAGLRSEAYQLTTTRNGRLQTISLINERHITCKQYSLTFDTTSFQIEHIYARLTNLDAPLRKEKEKIFEISLTEYDGKAKLQQFLTPEKVVITSGGIWKTTGRFNNYQLIDN